MKKKNFGRISVAVHGNEFVAGYGVGGGRRRNRNADAHRDQHYYRGCFEESH